ncbi:MAG TPA: cupin domain-containing protein [Caulobacteraceae bacterium]|jgi:quercetin dioxygenase-like cupin family protein
MLLALLAAAAAATAPAPATPQKPDSTIAPISTTTLFDVPGKALSASKVSYPPGGKDPSHVHPNAVFVYVLTGAVRSAADDGPVTTYHAGETFYLPAGHTHRVSENASATEPASLLAVQVVEQRRPGGR